MRRATFIPLMFVVTIVVIGGMWAWKRPTDPAVVVLPQNSSGQIVHRVTPDAYLYYMLKEPTGFVLARTLKGLHGQPVGQPQSLIGLGSGFGRVESDSVASMQLSPDGGYLAIDGVRDHGEQVWIYNTQRGTLALVPDGVIGNFLHWLPAGSGHTFLYRPMLPMGPDTPMDGGGWNPGLWQVDAATGIHRNIAIGTPSANLIDAAPSPDGTRIVYSTTAGLGMGSETYLMQADGSQRRLLLHTTESASTRSIAGLFAWSPDSTQIAYEQLSDSVVPFLPADLWVMKSDGSHQQRLTEIDGGHGYGLSWSPNGMKIVFVARTNSTDHRADQDAQALQTAIGVFDLASQHAQYIASSQQTGSQINSNPSWSLNSKSITFTALNPINRIVGGTPRYWLVDITASSSLLHSVPITTGIPHFIAAS